MSNRWPGGLIRKTPVTPAGPDQDGAAPGVWTLAEAAYWIKQGLWPTAGRAQYVAVSHATTPFVSAYAWSISGFGAKFADPATLPTSTGYDVAFSPSGNAIAVAHNITPFVSAYPWSVAGFGTKFSNPATLPTGDGFGVAFSSAGNAIAVGHTTTPFISAYPWSGSGFGTKFANPATLPTGNANGVAFGTT